MRILNQALYHTIGTLPQWGPIGEVPIPFTPKTIIYAFWDFYTLGTE